MSHRSTIRLHEKLDFTDGGRHADVTPVTGPNDLFDGGSMLEADTGLLAMVFGSSDPDTTQRDEPYLPEAIRLAANDRLQEPTDHSALREASLSSPVRPTSTAGDDPQRLRLERLRQAILSDTYDNELKFSIAADRLIDKVVK